MQAWGPVQNHSPLENSMAPGVFPGPLHPRLNSEHIKEKGQTPERQLAGHPGSKRQGGYTSSTPVMPEGPRLEADVYGTVCWLPSTPHTTPGSGASLGGGPWTVHSAAATL